MTANYPQETSGPPYSRTVAGPIRTAVQLLPSAVFTEFIDAFLYDLSERQYAALAALLLLFFSWGQNYLESKKNSYFLR